MFVLTIEKFFSKSKIPKFVTIFVTRDFTVQKSIGKLESENLEKLSQIIRKTLISKFLEIEESITNKHRYIRSSYLEIDRILSEPGGMIISFITDDIYYYIKF